MAARIRIADGGALRRRRIIGGSTILRQVSSRSQQRRELSWSVPHCYRQVDFSG